MGKLLRGLRLILSATTSDSFTSSAFIAAPPLRLSHVHLSRHLRGPPPVRGIVGRRAA